MPKPTLRELSRQASRQRISDVAIELFCERGYDATTVEEIATAAGISERTFFRYFATKDEAFFSRTAEDTDAFIARIQERPVTEAPWESLQHAVERAIDELDQEAEIERSRQYRAILAGSADLTAHQFARMSESQQLIGEVLWERWLATHGGAPGFDPEACADTRLVLRVIVGAMLGVLSEVLLVSEHQPPEERMRLVRATLDAIRPGRQDLGGSPAAG